MQAIYPPLPFSNGLLRSPRFTLFKHLISSLSPSLRVRNATTCQTADNAFVSICGTSDELLHPMFYCPTSRVSTKYICRQLKINEGGRQVHTRGYGIPCLCRSLMVCRDLQRL